MTVWRRVWFLAGGLAAAGLIVFVVMWTRCGLRGCPDVDMLKGYMPDQASRVLDRNGDEVAKLFVTRRVVIGIDSIPKHVQDAFVAVEDKRFWKHGGVDWRRVLGALARNVKAGGIEQGSSTITMQLARNIFPDKLPARQRTLARKLGEARVAMKIEHRYTKQEILELYLNQIYFGEGAWGIEAAAEEYFGKSATRLTLPEAATLAALPRAPSRLNPRADPDAARAGRRLVLSRMAEQGLITAAEAQQAADAKLKPRRRTARSQDQAPYFVEAVRRQLEDQLGDAIYTQGYVIRTTLDLHAQQTAENVLGSQLRAIESGAFGGFPHPTYASVQADTTQDANGRDGGTDYLQGAFIIMEASTGDILALVGGRNFGDSQFNRATQALRQPGSAFKPFVYAAALQSGIPPTHRLLDEPLRMVIDRGRVWEPRNFGGSYSGVVTMRQALTYSKNVATVRLASEVGIGQVLQMAQNMGLGNMQPNPSVVLGTDEVTPMQLTAAYGAFATLGNRPEPRYVLSVEDRNGQVVWAQPPVTRQVIGAPVAFLTVSLMEDVVNRGTGTGVRAAGFTGPAAGKTGTTQDASDAWFVGITPQLVGTVWIGFDRRQPILRGTTGGEIAAPVWGRAMQEIGANSNGWPVPAGIEQHLVNAVGAAVGEGCPADSGSYQEYFLAGTAPVATCWVDPNLAYSDTVGVYGDSAWAAYEQQRAEEDSWWARLRGRIFGADSMRGRQADTGVIRPDTFAIPVEPRDTPRTPPPRPLGRPAVTRPDTLRMRLRPETLQTRLDTLKARPDTTRVRPDTLPGPQAAATVPGRNAA